MAPRFPVSYPLEDHMTPPLSKKEIARRQLAADLASGRITQARYDERIARLNTRGQASRRRNLADQKARRAYRRDASPPTDWRPGQ